MLGAAVVLAAPENRAIQPVVSHGTELDVANIAVQGLPLAPAEEIEGIPDLIDTTVTGLQDVAPEIEGHGACVGVRRRAIGVRAGHGLPLRFLR